MDSPLLICFGGAGCGLPQPCALQPRNDIVFLQGAASPASPLYRTIMLSVHPADGVFGKGTGSCGGHLHQIPNHGRKVFVPLYLQHCRSIPGWDGGAAKIEKSPCCLGLCESHSPASPGHCRGKRQRNPGIVHNSLGPQARVSIFHSSSCIRGGGRRPGPEIADQQRLGLGTGEAGLLLGAQAAHLCSFSPAPGSCRRRYSRANGTFSRRLTPSSFSAGPCPGGHRNTGCGQNSGRPGHGGSGVITDEDAGAGTEHQRH